MNKHRYGSIFPLIQLKLDREIQGLSLNVWYTVEIMSYRLFGVFAGRVYKIHVFYIGEGMVWNSEVLISLFN